jgi:hypothetical protein
MKTLLHSKGDHQLMMVLQKISKFVTAQKFILAVIIGLLAHTEVSAHASTITRKWCGGFFHRKFVASAQTSVLSYTRYQTGYNCIGQYVGTANIGSWSSTCSNESKGCSRPQTATCSKSGTVYDRIFSGCYLQYTNPQYYNSYAQAQHLVSGISLNYYAYGRGSAGHTGNYLLNPDLFNLLVDNEKSAGEIRGDVDITDNNQLVINKMNGKLGITAGASYFSNIKIVVIKENQNISDDEALQHEEQVQNGTYPDVVYSAQLNISKNGITHEGVFSEGIASGSIKEFNANQEYGVNINDFSVVAPVNAELQEDEKLTLVTVIDGGFDISSAVVSKNANDLLTSNTADSKMPKLYPNPAKDYVDITLDADKKEFVHVRIVSPFGKISAEKVESLNIGRQTIRLNTEQLLPGVYLVEIQSEGNTYSRKLLISK